VAQSLDGTEFHGLRDAQVGAGSGFQKGSAHILLEDRRTEVLKESLAYCAKALEGMDDQKAISTPQMSYAFLHVIVHNNEIYGNWPAICDPTELFRPPQPRGYSSR